MAKFHPNHTRNSLSRTQAKLLMEKAKQKRKRI